MKYSLVLFISFFMACGKTTQTPQSLSAITTGCTVSSVASGTIIDCGGTQSTVTNGYNALISSASADASVCPNGGSVFTMGQDKNYSGFLDLVEVTSSAVVCNGATGAAGLNAPATPFSPIGLLAPCAANPMAPTSAELSNPDLEVFLKLSNGTILTSYSETVAGYNTHFGVLSPGRYMSTGAGNCNFTYSNGVITR